MKKEFKEALLYKAGLLILLIAFHFSSLAQTFVTGPINQPNTAGQFYHNAQIILSPGFSANGNNGAFRAFISSSLPIPSAFTGDENFVSTWSPRVPVKSAQELKDIESLNGKLDISVKYIDGLGRPMQFVEKSSTPNASDFIKPFEYDQQSREVKTYLPYAASSGQPGTYRPQAINVGQPSFYNSGSNLVAQSNTPYAQSVLEASPLERVLEKGGVGDAWQPQNNSIANSGHTVKLSYDANNTLPISDVENTKLAVFYSVSIDINGNRSLTSSGNYADRQLYVTVVKDEDWKVGDGRAGTVETYADQDGQTILKRCFNRNSSNQLEVLSTYYVYDDFGNLSYVLPPGANPDTPSGGTILSDLLNKFCYQYAFDSKQRATAKKNPGRDWEYSVYNSLNQVVAVQNGKLREKNEWLVTKYDTQGRIILTGLWNNNNNAISRDALQADVNQSQNLWEERTSTGTGYTAYAWPQSLDKTLTLNYYDDYNVPGLPADYTYQAYAGNPDGKSSFTSGKLTCAKTWPLSNNGLALWSVNYYNADGRVIQVHTTNHLQGKELVNTEFDFAGLTTIVNQQHTSATQNVIKTHRYTYDHHGRPIRQYIKIGTGDEIILNQKQYNELGQLVDKSLHQKAGSSKYLQSIDYRYNLKGNLTSINDPLLANATELNSDDNSLIGSDKFGMSIFYENAAIPQYNGIIGALKWQSAAVGGSGGLSVDQYDYRYDKLNRLTQAVSSINGNKNKNFDEYISYDPMGNIKTLGRWAKLSNGRVQIDSLHYSYSGNQADQIDDVTNNNVYGFVESSKSSGELSYDANGNLNKDLNKGITSVTYNVFDLPQTIVWNDGRSITYDYDGKGNKLKKSYSTATTTLNTDYAGDYQYEQGQLAFINTEEGLVRRDGSGGYKFQYTLTDHLGNTHVMIQPAGADESIAEIVQVSNYYPFGLEMKSDDPGALVSYVSGEKNNYLFNGKEEQQPSGMLDFGARYYDPATGRWNAPDPASQFMHESPYAALANNPIAHIDPDGRILPWVAAAVVGAAIGGTVNVALHIDKIMLSKTPWKDGFAAFGIGAVAGGVAGATGGASLLATTGTSTLAAIGTATAVGAYTGATASLIQGVGNHYYFGDPYSPTDFITSAFYGGLTGGVFKSVEISLSHGSGYLGGPGHVGILPSDLSDDASNTAISQVQYTKSTLQYGQQMHKAYKLADVIPGVAEKEFTGIPGIRPDFVDFSTKTIYELKPFNPRAIQQGLKQLGKYQSAFQLKYGGQWKVVLDTY